MDHPEEILLLKLSRFHVARLHEPLAAGGERIREVIRHPGAVTIVPILDGGQVCLIRNRRAAVAQTLLELPAGTLDPNEPPQVCAHRELSEETGFLAKTMKPVQSFFMSPGILDERMHLFVAEGLRSGPTCREPGELIENHIVTWREAISLVDSGAIQDAKTIVGLLMYDRLRDAR